VRQHQRSQGALGIGRDHLVSSRRTQVAEALSVNRLYFLY